ncbi:hemolysin family protein [Paraliomyxa miuraensis]|uniref:hemolysin family protein n=1 Tax=Paraliomyxa miuraensis TaxID=376150 RepID=UPI002253F8F7|nr:hemolysin family protein [Paraliomyxa miuraensis]MCX4239365.1 hemolysin family protein [Paraliomyxa miuraensis]
MSDADTLGILTILLCLGGSMFFSSSETALTSLGPHQARKILEEGGRHAKTVATWVERPVRVLSTILVGNNVANTLMGSVATALAIRHLGGGNWGEYAVPVAVFFTTALLLVFGEILPKAAGRLYSQRMALPVLAALNVLDRILAPITWALAKLTDLMLRRVDPEESAPKVTADELDYLVKVGQREGSIPADQAALLRGIFRFEDKIVRDIMVARDRVTAIDLDWDIQRVIERAHGSGHSRMPVYEGDLDHIKGVLHIKQLVGLRHPGRADIKRLMRAPMFVSESLLIQDLLQRFREQRVHMAIVVDDGGRTVGVVTLEDVLEQIVGQIFDESDHAPAGAAVEHAGVLHLDGQASLTRIEEKFEVEFDELEGVDSIGDLLTQLAGQMPTPGSVFVYEGIRYKVLAANDRRVIRVSAEQIEFEDEDD